MIKTLAAYLPASLLAGLIWFLSSRPGLGPLPRIPHIDKVAHFFTFGMLCVLILAGMKKAGKRPPERNRLFLAVGITALYGLVDEIHQAFVPFRCTDIFDLLSDGLGALLAAWLFHIFLSGKSHKQL